MRSKGKPLRGAAFHGHPFPWSALCLFALAFLYCPPGYAQKGDLAVRPVNPAERVSLAGHHPAWASAQNDIGAVPAGAPLEQLAIVLARSPQQQQAFDQFLTEQQDPASINFHHWLTPVEVGERFGASQQDIDAVTNWLQSRNLRVDSLANNRMIVRFSGAAADVAGAFSTELHYFAVDGEQRMSISAEPQIPAALAGVIKSVSGLATLTFHPHGDARLAQVPLRAVAGDPASGITPDFTSSSSGNHYIFPGDFATIYNVNVGNINGAGQTIAIIGIANVYVQDILNFQTLSGLAQKAPTTIVPPNGVNPPNPVTTAVASVPAAQAEATGDVDRAGSIAPGATIDLVISGNKSGASGLDIATQYVVDTTPVFAQIMSLSFGGCESTNGLAGVTFFDTLFSAAAAEGISVFDSSGDSGAAGCDAHFVTPPASQFLSPNFLCSSSHVTCVGGTEFADTTFPGPFWSATNTSGTNASALGYIPEGAWNDPLNSNNQVQVAGTGGGVSAFIPTPSWQTGTGVPGTQGRYTPDVSFSASVHDGYFGCMAALGACGPVGNSFFVGVFAGTSMSAPSMAGVTALLNQKMGAPQGELNANLYRLAATPANNVFHDVTVASSGVASCAVTTPSMCNNSTPSPAGLTGGLSGYLVGAGFDEATGLGSINVANLLSNWSTKSGTTATVTSSLNPFASGASVTLASAVTTSGANGPTGTVTFFDGATQLGSAALNGSGHASLTISTLTTLGQHPITAVYGGDASNATSTSPALTVTVSAATFSLAANAPASRTISSGQSAGYSLSVTPTGSYTSTVSFTCSFSPASSAVCMFSPPTITPNASAASTTLTITGAQAGNLHFTGRKKDWYRIAPLSGLRLVGIYAGALFLLSWGMKFGARRRLQFSLAGALLLVTALAGCGGAGSGTATQSTPKTYQVTITASAPASANGSSAGVSQTQMVSLTVQ
ncbi:MAG: Ig-like domain repeat protein [Acidobacteriia bacterium]|nr:Ig-like domain repeat protein [Terriglobia bacterium]